MKRSTGKPDSNQAEMVAALRQIGAVVLVVSGVPGLGCDLIVAYRRRVWIVEVKDGSKPPSKRKLEPSEIKLQSDLTEVGGILNIWIDTEQAIREVTS